MTDPAHFDDHYRSAEDIWRQGCAGSPLDDKAQNKFTVMARSRFHTFALSASHASTTGNGEKIAGLIRGLALELHGAPGLADHWYDSEFDDDSFGGQVTAYLQDLDRQEPDSAEPH